MANECDDMVRRIHATERREKADSHQHNQIQLV